MLQPPVEAQGLEQSALGKPVELARRRAKLGIEELATSADIEIADLIALESGEPVMVEPRTVYRLCEVLQLPQAGVMELAGLTQKRASSLGAAVVRFAAHSKSIEKLSHESGELSTSL